MEIEIKLRGVRYRDCEGYAMHYSYRRKDGHTPWLFATRKYFRVTLEASVDRILRTVVDDVEWYVRKNVGEKVGSNIQLEKLAELNKSLTNRVMTITVAGVDD